MISPEILRRFPHFAKFSSDSFSARAMASELHPFQAGQWILNEGEFARNLCILLSGEVHVAYRMGNDELAVSDSISTGEAFSWSAMLAPHTLTASCIGNKAGEYISVDAKLLRDLITEDANGVLYLMMELAKTMRDRINGLRVQIVASTPKLILTEA